MNYLKYYPVDVLNGEGTRCTLFVSGCEHLCRGCHNSTSWDHTKGNPVDQKMEDRIIADLNDTRIVRDGLSLSGGDPMFWRNLDGILKLILRVKNETVGKNIWLWTGYRLSELSPRQRAIIEMVDVVIDGRFELDKRDLNLAWRGSSNQRVLRISQT